MHATTEQVERQQYLAFVLAGGDYAVGILKVKEILQYEEIVKVPTAPRSVRGILNLRGRVVPVVDVAIKFGLPETPVTKRTCVLVVETAFDGVPAVMGLMADAVSEVVELAAEDLEAPPDFGADTAVDFLVGVGKAGGRFVLILDIDRVLSAGDREIVTAEPAAPSPEGSGEPPAVCSDRSGDLLGPEGREPEAAGSGGPRGTGESPAPLHEGTAAAGS